MTAMNVWFLVTIVMGWVDWHGVDTHRWISLCADQFQDRMCVGQTLQGMQTIRAIETESDERHVA